MNNRTKNLWSTLEDQNPWWHDREARVAKDYPHARSEFQSIMDRMSASPKRAILILGPRAVGKTILLRQWIDHLLENGVDGRTIIHADFDDPRIPGGISINDVWELAHEELPLLPGAARHFVIDEIHASVRWAQWLRRLVDRTSDRFLATDSASAILSAGSRETGQARFDEIHVGYLNFRDFYFLQRASGKKSIGGGEEDLDGLLAAQAIEDYLVLGGFPAHVHMKNVAEARRLVRQDIEEKAILKDLGRLARGDITLLRDIFVACIEKSGSIFDATKWQKEISEHPTRQRLARSILQLEATRLLSRLPRYGRFRQDELRAHPKIYALDPGLVSAFSRPPDPAKDPSTIGAMVETAVFRHLMARARAENLSLSFYREPKTGLECDFVLRSGPTTILIEATASRSMSSEKIRALSRISGRLRGPRKAICVSRCLSEARHTVEGIEIHEIPLWSFLDRVSRRPLEDLNR